MSALNQIRTTGIDQAKLVCYPSAVEESEDGGEIRNRYEPPGTEGEKNEAD